MLKKLEKLTVFWMEKLSKEEKDETF